MTMKLKRGSTASGASGAAASRALGSAASRPGAASLALMSSSPPPQAAARISRVRQRLPCTRSMGRIIIARGPAWGAPRSAPAEAQLPHHEERLDDDGARHLRLAYAAILEDDRDLAQGHAGLDGAVLYLDLKAVTVRAHCGQIDALEGL